MTHCVIDRGFDLSSIQQGMPKKIKIKVVNPNFREGFFLFLIYGSVLNLFTMSMVNIQIIATGLIQSQI